jgi:ferrochelatase
VTGADRPGADRPGTDRPGVLLLTYGSPATLERNDIRAYLARVRGGREPDPELVDEFTRRYRIIGGSPLIEITRAQATALADRLGWQVEIGMRFSDPSILNGLSALARSGITSVAAIILSPQFSTILMNGYAASIDDALAALGDAAPEVVLAGAWHDQPALIEAIASRIEEARARLGDDGSAPVLLTAHSLPLRVALDEPDYIAQLRETADAVAARAGLPNDRWQFCWQSAGHEPGEWMKPDFADLMPELASRGSRAVIVAPIQFLADHLEILYDIDVGARQQAEAAGLAFQRIESLNTHPGLIEALARVAATTTRRTAAV